MADKAKHAFGMLERIDDAITSGAIDAYDILFVKDANGKPYVGWIDKDGNKVIVQEEEKVVMVEGETLPEKGEIGKVYIFNEEGYFWDGERFAKLSKATDLTGLESQITELKSEITTKVDTETVLSMIEKYSESRIEVVEF